MLTYRGDKFVRGKTYKLEESLTFIKREEENLVFESANKEIISMTESEFESKQKELLEKINQENEDINEIIGKVIRSKGLARKYEDLLKSKGISINYDNPQGVTLTGPNGKTLSASSKEVYGPHTPDSSGDRYDKNGYYRKADGHYKTNDKYDAYYAKELASAEEELETLRNMDRDDIIRKYNTKSTDEAIQQHEKDMESLESRIARYKKNDEENKKYHERELKRAKTDRRLANINPQRTATSKLKADETIDYLNYLTKPANEYMDKIRNAYKGYGYEDNRSKSNPENYIKTDETDLDKYQSLKRNVNQAKDDIEKRTAGDDSRFRYSSAAMTDEQLEAKIQSMRDDLEKKIEELRNSNKANTKERDSYVKELEKKEKELDDFLKAKGIRKEGVEILKRNLLEEADSDDLSYYENRLNTIAQDLEELVREIAYDKRFHPYVYKRLENAYTMIEDTNLKDYFNNPIV